MTSAVAHWVRSYKVENSALRSGLWPSSPMPRAGGRRNSPQGGRHGCRPGDRQGRTPCRSTPPPVCDPAGARHRGGLSFGYFSLAKQRKVTRPPAGGRKPAVPRGLPSVAGEPGRGNATTKDRRNGMTRFARPCGAALRAFCALRAPSGLRRDDDKW